MIRNILALAVIGLLATGCSSKPANDGSPPKVSATVAAQSIADTQKEIQSIQNNPAIPDGTKQSIIGHLQGNIARTKAAVAQ